MTRRALAVAVLLAALPFPAWATPHTVAIAAASDLKFALDDLLVGFRAAHPETTVTVTYGSSGTFTTQLQQAAPFDVFLSADIAYPKDLESKGLTAPDSVFTYAVGRLVLWVPSASKLDLATLGLNALTDPSVKHIAIANPAHAPYGKAAEAALATNGLLDVVRPKLVLGENISQAAQFVQSGAADAGIIALSLAVAPPMAQSGRYWEVPLTAYPTLLQGGCILKSAQDPTDARLVTAYLGSAAGRTVLDTYGFILPGPP